jgi:histidinol dehydrogenase
LEVSELRSFVQEVFENIKQNGDLAVVHYIDKYDNVSLSSYQVTKEEFQEAEVEIQPKLRAAIIQAKSNIEKFHISQVPQSVEVDISNGIKCWQKCMPIESVGLYIPGGTAPLFSTVLMLAIPAYIAGCTNIVLASPPDKKTGKLHPAILFAANLCGVHNIYKMGGAHAIAALSMGTETVPRTYKIFGPGNQYVTAAKQYAFQLGTAIDMPAGPSEVLVFADSSANPEFVASDLLSQAEHGIDSQVVLISTERTILSKILSALERQSKSLPRKEIVDQSLKNSFSIFFNDIDDAFEFINDYAPEHFIISSETPDQYFSRIRNAGSVFVGNFSPESAGDYASGTNHTLPTAGAAKAFSGVNMDAYYKKITFQKLSEIGLKEIGNSVIQMARAEGLEAHARAVEIRLNR